VGYLYFIGTDFRGKNRNRLAKLGSHQPAAFHRGHAHDRVAKVGVAAGGESKTARHRADAARPQGFRNRIHLGLSHVIGIEQNYKEAKTESDHVGIGI